MLYFEVPINPSTPLGPGDVVGECMGRGVYRVLLDHGALPAEFFDLSTGLAGEFMQKFANYGIRAAAVVPSLAAHSASFQDFAREASRSQQCRFFPSRGEAIAWLTEGG